MNIKTAGIACGALVLGSAAGHGQTRAWPQGPDNFLPFINAPAQGAAMTQVPKLLVSFGGKPVPAVLDTGSTGVVVSAAMIPDFERQPSLGPATLSYSSSGRVMHGRWIVEPVTLIGRDKTSITTQPIRIMAVTRVTCFQNARDCAPEAMPRHVAMLGVGFAREADHQPQGTPDKNPLLNLPGMAKGTARRGYIVTREGVHVGLTAANADGFGFVRLTRGAPFPDWSATPACITIQDRAAPACGTALVDTGVAGMFLTVPRDTLAQDAQGRPPLPAGGTIVISFGGSPGAPQSVAAYSFTIGGRDATAPSHVTLVATGQRATFVNTSFHVLNGFDYLFDADDGLVGLREAPLAPPPG